MRFCCLALPLLAAGAAIAEPALTCDIAARQAALTHGVPEPVMLAITRVETGRDQGGTLTPWPWAINMGGEGFWPETRENAVTMAQTALEEGRQNMDIGCFQLNIRWHAENFASLDDMFDPVRNADYAARFLSRLHDETGSWVAAVAAYHSRSPDLAEAYVARVETVLAAAEPLLAIEPALPRPNLFPLLQPGRAASPGSLVPGREGAIPLFGTGS